MSFDMIEFECRHDTAWITLNRPQALNAIKPPETLRELHGAFEMVRNDPTLRSVVLTGAGDKAFCIGTDISFLSAAYETRDFSRFRDYLEQINETLFALEELPLPTVAMVQGNARAGGFELILACDFLIMADDARIGDVHTPFGHIPGAGSTQRLARRIGIQRTLHLILSGQWLSGPEAVEAGLALKSVPRQELREATERLVEDFSNKSRESLMYVKRAVLRGWDLPLRDGVNLEVQSYIEYLATSNEPAERFRANQERRRARKGLSTQVDG